MSYGIPYKGSKNVLAERIVAILPSGSIFADCACGGGAVLQAAALSGKFKEVRGYDVEKSVTELLDALINSPGAIDWNARRCVSKENFYEARDRNGSLDDYVTRYSASFGFNGMEYLWGEKRIPFKKLMHDAVTLPTRKERREALRDFMTLLVSSDLPIDDLKNLCHMEQLTSLERMEELESRMQSEPHCPVRLETRSMFDLPYEEFDVIYFDPPYAGTKGYNRRQFSQILFTALLSALKQAGKHVFVSEYECPCEGYTEIWSAKKQMTQKCDENRIVTERLFFSGTLDEYNSLVDSSRQAC